MATNKYFQNVNHRGTQRLTEDLVVESIAMHGIDVYYLPKTLVNRDTLFGSDSLKKFTTAAKLIEKKILSDSNIFLCGNGGSAAIANHYICDFLKVLRTGTNLKPKFFSLISNLETISSHKSSQIEFGLINIKASIIYLIYYFLYFYIIILI